MMPKVLLALAWLLALGAIYASAYFLAAAYEPWGTRGWP